MENFSDSLKNVFLSMTPEWRKK